MRSLYEHQIIHRDIKPDNILLHKGNFKLADLGFARFIEKMEEADIYTSKGTPVYMSYEVIK